MPGNRSKIEQKRDEKLNPFGRIKKVLKDWRKDICDIVIYKPNSEGIVKLICKTEEERNEILKTKKFLTGKNFCLQIGKTKEDGGTIYSDIMLWIGIEYMINHTKEGEKSIIQIFSEVGDLLPQEKEKGVHTPEKEKEQIEKLIKKKFGEKGKCIEVIIGSKKDEHKDVFDALKSKPEGERRFGIIPNEEPKIGKYLSNTKKEDLTSLPIIQYLAYHVNKDENLMKLFYETKPPKYKKKDKDNKDNKDNKDENGNYKPGSADADYYGIVEVGLRLTEILKGVSIQGGVGRQRVYDKIISLIINGEDTIQGDKDFDCGEDLKIDNYPALKKLHGIISNKSKEKGLNTDFKQLYIELNRTKLDEIKEKIKRRKRIRNINFGVYLAAILLGGGGTVYSEYNKLQKMKAKQENEWLEQEAQLKELKEQREIAKTYPYNDSITKYYEEHKWQELHDINYKSDMQKYEEEQEEKLMSAYDLSKFNTEIRTKNMNTDKNVIRDTYSIEFQNNYITNKKYLSADDFMRNYRRILSKYKIEYKKPYEHLKPYKEYIENSLKFGDKIDISKYKVKEIKIKDNETGHEKEFSYYMEKNKQTYRLKFVELSKNDEKPPIKIVIVEDGYYGGKELSMDQGKKVLEDLVKNYGKNLGYGENSDINYKTDE